MTVSIDINQADIDRVAKKLGSIARLNDKMRPPMVKSLSLLQDDIATYPKKRKGAFSALATKAQKRAYWARVSSGEIDHGPGGYRRTGTLGRKWDSRIKDTGAGLVGTLGNNTNYGRYVHGARSQQLFHFASGWKQTDDVMAKRRKDIVHEFRKVIRRELLK